MKTAMSFALIVWTSTVQGLSWPWEKRDASVISGPDPYTTVMETECTSTQIITLAPETSTFPCSATSAEDLLCSTVETFTGTVVTQPCATVATVSIGEKDCEWESCVVYGSSTIQTSCVTKNPDTYSTSYYACNDQAVPEVPCVTVTTPTSISTSVYPCTTTVTITQTDVVISNTTKSVLVPIPVPTTTTETNTVTITRNGSVTVSTQTVIREIPMPTTVLVPTVSISTTTVTEEGQEFVRNFTVTNNVPVVTSIVSTVVSVQQGTTVTSLQTLTQTLSATITQPAPAPAPVTLVSTVLSIQSGTNITSLLTVTQPLNVITQPAPPPVTVVLTVPSEQAGPGANPLPIDTQSVGTDTLPPVTGSRPTGTVIPTSLSVAESVCQNTGPSPSPDPAGCQGRDCALTFEEGAYVHWEVFEGSPPLLTELTFANPSARQTCYTTSCNSAAFTQYYSTSVTSCLFPPCPSNFLDCHCSIVIGNLRLPNGQLTSVTQTGDSGWNLNLGPTVTAENVGVCGPDGASCVDFATTTLFTPVVYTGSVTSTTVFNPELGLTVVDWLLPQLTDYFPPGNPFGQCTTVTLATPSVIATAALARLLVRQDSQPATEGGSKTMTYKQVPSILVRGYSYNAGETSTETATVTAQPLVEGTSPPVPNQNSNIPDPAQTQPQAAPPAIPSQPAAAVPSSGPATPQQPTASAPAPAVGTNPSVPGPGTVPSVETPYTTQIGTAPAATPADGTGVITETVFYSQILPPASQSALSQLSELSNGVETYTGDQIGALVCSVLGCSYNPTGGVTFTANSTADADNLLTSAETTTASDASGAGSATSPATSYTGAAVKGRVDGLAWAMPMAMGVFWN